MASILDRFRLDGKVAIVTGASRGLGAAMAQALAEAGADVVLVARGDMAALQKSIAVAGRRSIVVPADVGTAPAAAKIVAAAYEAFGRADILVNNAGIIRRAPALTADEHSWRQVLQVNLDSVFLLCRLFGAPMCERGRGKIINVASLLSFQGGLNVSSYTASKHGVAGLTKALANEWAAGGVNVNAVAPGYVVTANTEQLRLDRSRAAEIQARIPAGRWARPDDIAGAVVFLASAAADYVHGHLLVVDGGWMAR